MSYKLLSFRVQDTEDKGRIEIQQDGQDLQLVYSANPASIPESEAFKNRIRVIKAAIKACDDIKQLLEKELE